MRLQLVLRPQAKRAIVPFNYQYPLSAAIYRILHRASPEYARFLHDRGYAAPSGRLMKLFTFSKLNIPNVRPANGGLEGSGGPWTLQVGSPMLDEFVQHFVLGLFHSAEVSIGAAGFHAVFRIEQVESLASPEFGEKMRFRCLSPVVISTMHEHNGRLQPYYYRPDDPKLGESIRKNLLEKYEIVNLRKAEDDRLQFYLESQDKPRSKLIKIKEGSAEETHLKAFETFFTLEGSAELMQAAWECGIGEHNSQGFGMVEAIPSLEGLSK
jgi:CRISPR-associated endoribonuclease Cas6